LPFVNDGYERACKAIRAEVESKYARRLSEATGEERKALLEEIEAEVREMIKSKAPPEALY
jgi:hypothetical protein